MENYYLQCLKRPRSLHLPGSPIHLVVAVVRVGEWGGGGGRG